MVVFDDHSNKPNTMDMTHKRHTGGVTRPLVKFEKQMKLKLRKEKCLSKKLNKQSFINILSIMFRSNG
jgi:hypothetical protein